MLIARLDPALDQGTSALHAVLESSAQPAASAGAERARRTSLGAYLVMRLVARTLEAAGQPDPALELQRVSTVQFVDELPTTVAECAHLRSVMAALPGGDEDRGPLRGALLRYASWLEREGRLDLGLETLRLVARTWNGEIPPGNFTVLALEVGRVNRQLARLCLAEDAYQAAADSALLTGDRLGQLRARLGGISVRRLQGETTLLGSGLCNLLDECQRDPALAPLIPLIHAELGALSSAAGQPEEAVGAMVAAVRSARSVPERLQMLAGLGRVLLELGVRDLAAPLLEHVVARSPDRLVRAGAEVALMDIASLDGNRLAFERLRVELNRRMVRLPATMRTEFHYRAGLGFARFSQLARAERSWSAGRALAMRHGLDYWIEMLPRRQRARGGHADLAQVVPPWVGSDAILADVRGLLPPAASSVMPAMEFV